MEKRWIWPFELEEQIGSGAMGVVYRARFVKNDRRVALKLLPKEVAVNPTLAARFQREMEILKDLKHPHIVHSFGGTCEGDQWFYAMELVDGGTLGTLLQEQGKLPWRQVIELGLQICAGLDYAHSRGVIHRDLKPGNLLLMKSGKVKLGDFGLALVVAETRLTATGKTMGSLHYMAPEQIQGKPPLSSRTDLYALGCVLFELLCGRTPFVGEAMAEVLQQHIRQPPPKVSSFALDCPIQLESVVSDLLQKDPERRPATAQDVANRLREIDRDISVKSPRFDKNRPLESSATKTGSAIISSAPLAWNWPLAVLLVITLFVAVGQFMSRRNQQRLFTRSEGQLTSALRDQQQIQAVRVFAAKSLGDLGADASSALEPLLEVMSDPDILVRSEAAHAIAQIGSADANLIASLRRIQARDEQPQVRSALDDAIAQLSAKPADRTIMPYIIGGGLLAALGGAGYWVWTQAKET